MTIAPKREPVTFTAVEEVFAALRRADHRVSGPARAVLEALFAADRPLTADEIADGLRDRAPDLASVYRNLERLERLGAVSHVHAGHGPGLYALVRGRDPEYLVCDRCGAITPATSGALDRVREAVRDAFGHEADFSHFPIHGVCSGCAAAHPPAVPPKGSRVMHEHSHDEPHAHEHSHGDVTHTHEHTEHDHEHVEHEHEHSHGDVTHTHPHVHEAGLEDEDEHRHDHE